MIFTDIIAQNGYIGQYIRFVYYFSPMYNVSTWVVIRIYWKIYVPRASGPLDYIFQYIRITTHVLYQYISLDRIIALAPGIPCFKGLDMRNLQYWIRICQKSHYTVTNQLHFICGLNFYETDVKTVFCIIFAWVFFQYSSDKIRTTQHEHLYIVHKNLNRM